MGIWWVCEFGELFRALIQNMFNHISQLLSRDRGILFWGCPTCVHTHKKDYQFVIMIPCKLLWGILPNLQLRCSWNKSKLVRFRGVKRCKATARQHVVRDTLWLIPSGLRGAWTYFNDNCHSYSLPGWHDTDDVFMVVGLKVKVTGNFFRQCTFRRRHFDRLKTIWLIWTHWATVDCCLLATVLTKVHVQLW